MQQQSPSTRPARLAESETGQHSPHQGLLRQHLRNCERVRTPWHRLECMAETVYDAVAPRLVTTTALVLVVAVLIEQMV